MDDIKVFISNVQSKFVEERRFLCKYIYSDILGGKLLLVLISYKLTTVHSLKLMSSIFVYLAYLTSYMIY